MYNRSKKKTKIYITIIFEPEFDRDRIAFRKSSVSLTLYAHIIRYIIF